MFLHDPQLSYATQVAQAIAREHQHGQYGPAHLLKGLLHNDVGLASQLVAWGKNIHQLRQWADVRIARYAKTARTAEKPGADAQVTRLLEVADIVRLKFSEETLGPLAALTALCRPGLVFTEEQLKSFPLTEGELTERVLAGLPAAPAGTGPAAPGRTAASPAGDALARYGIDKTELARQGKLDPVIGRSREIRMMAEIMGRRTKPNVLLVGEPGVGKTALADGFAQSIADGKVPPAWRSASVIELDLGALAAGASYKGEVEDRLKKIIAELKGRERCVLFIDEIHSLLDPRGGAGEAANLLKPELARGNLTVIGATTSEEYRKFVEKDEAFNRRFELLRVEEPDEATTGRILRTLVPRYEAHHGLSVAAESVPEAVRLAKRYLRDRRLPDAAIDLLDRTLSAVRLMKETSAAEIDDLEAALADLPAAPDADAPGSRTQELAWFTQVLGSRLSPILLALAEPPKEGAGNDGEGVPTGASESDEAVADRLRATLQRARRLDLAAKTRVEAADVAALVAHQIGIPLGKIQSGEREKLRQMAGQLRQRVIGQEHAVRSLADAVVISRADLLSTRRPIGSFFFLGPTGTGKTELAKAIAEFLFNDESFLLRFDMSEYGEKHAAAQLIGAPPGYVGYEEGGLLVDQLRAKPYAVVLFDEIEKAHPDVFKIFLQIMDEGRLTSRQGKVADFSNAIIIFTSNVGSDLVTRSFGQGRIPGQEALRAEMAGHFKDEFLGRLDEIIPFAPITREHIAQILDLQLTPLRQALRRRGITLHLSEGARDHLAAAGFSPRYGARPLRAVIRQQLQRPLAQQIIAEAIPPGSAVTLATDANGTLTWETHAAEPAAHEALA
ncbi:MAG: ATP-dependent Clp protease ATP-binding subunit [Cytophagales bacterium]|nr:ATP-dependent Clp protease ATP-binding subunit [Cytophagales bacterium]